MQLFYAPDITTPEYIMQQQESRHAVKALRLTSGDRLRLTDGRGHIYTAVVTDPDPRACAVRIEETCDAPRERPYRLTMAVALTKNPERYDWFLEKATEVGCDTFIPMVTENSERRTMRPERAEKIIAGAVKQSLKAWSPQLMPLASFEQVAAMAFEGRRLIAHCREGEKKTIGELVAPGGDVMIMIGPEGDFSQREVEAALAAGFGAATLGTSRLRTETAALMAVMAVNFVNQ